MGGGGGGGAPPRDPTLDTHYQYIPQPAQPAYPDFPLGSNRRGAFQAMAGGDTSWSRTGQTPSWFPGPSPSAAPTPELNQWMGRGAGYEMERYQDEKGNTYYRPKGSGPMQPAASTPTASVGAFENDTNHGG